MQGIRLLVCIALVVVPAAGVLSALRTRDRRLAAVAVAALVASVAVASLALRSAHVAPSTPDAIPASAEPPIEPESD